MTKLNYHKTGNVYVTLQWQPLLQWRSNKHYIVCVLVALGIHHAMRMRRIILASLACLVLQYFITLSLLLIFDQIAESLNMEISLSKAESLTISRNNVKCEIKLKDTTTEQVLKFNYLRVEIYAKRDLKQEVKMQTTKAACISGCLYNLI